MSRIVQRVDLSGLAEGWDADCYALVKPATYEDRKSFREMTAKGIDQSAEWQQELVESHFVSGKIKTHSSDGPTLVDITPEDLKVGILSDKLALEIMGFDLDPKGLARNLSAEQQPPNDASTDKSSSTTSPEASATPQPKS